MTLFCTSLNFAEVTLTFVAAELPSVGSCVWAGVLGALDSTEEPNTGVKGTRQAGLCVFSPK